MSELMVARNTFAGTRWKLQTTVSVLALLTAVCNAAEAETDNKPVLWIELGGQLEAISRSDSPFTAPFLTQTPTPDPYKSVSPIEAQKAPHFAFGGEGSITLDPKGTDWVFVAAVRYGRSNGKKHLHHQSARPPYSYRGRSGNGIFTIPITPTNNKSADTIAEYTESHIIVDFQAGKDVGLGMFGRGSSSVVSAGVRFAQFTSKSSANIHAEPYLRYAPAWPPSFASKYQLKSYFRTYGLVAHSQRSFHGLGPSLSWTGSAPIIGNPDAGEFDFDWGINAAVLFGRQKAAVDHQTAGYTRYWGHLGAGAFNRTALYNNPVTAKNRVRSVVVPNIGGFAGLSLKFSNAKVSLGYRADFFFGAMDAGIDTRRTADMSFHGPFATISIGLGG